LAEQFPNRHRPARAFGASSATFTGFLLKREKRPVREVAARGTFCWPEPDCQDRGIIVFAAMRD
jgi:hypothetical protein